MVDSGKAWAAMPMGTPPVDRMGEIMVEMQDADCLLAGLEGALAQLYEKIQPVLLPPIPADAHGEGDKIVRSKLAEHKKYQNDILRRNILLITEITNRIDL